MDVINDRRRFYDGGGVYGGGGCGRLVDGVGFGFDGDR